MAPACVDMCKPSATSANEPYKLPPTISTTIIAPHRTITAQVLRSFFSCPVPRKTCVCTSDIALEGFSIGSLATCWPETIAGGLSPPVDSKILRDSLKLFDQIPDLARHCIGSLFHAVVNMILDEFLLGVADRLLHGVQLLRQIHARASRLQHVDHGREVSLGALQSCADLGELVHYVDLIWVHILSP